MSNSLLFSVVIPTYNREKFIRKTLESVFAQSYPHFEVIVVDNCSTDDTVKVLQPFIKSKQIIFIQNARNEERAFSRNVGMDHAKGDYLTLLDSDDLMYEDNLADAADFALQNPTVKCFHSLYELLDGNGKIIYRYKFQPLHDRLKVISAGNFMSCIGDFIHRDIYRDYRFDTTKDLTGGEDWEFWLRVLADHNVGRIEKVNNGISHHEDRSINNQSVESMERGSKYMIEKFRSDPHLAAVYADHLDRIEAACLLYLNVLANDGGLKKQARSYLLAAVAKDKSVVFTSRFARSLRRTIMA